MKEILKKAITPIVLSIICGGICGKVVYSIYLNDEELAYDNNIIYLLQSGAYSSYDSMRANTTSYDYIYYEEDDLFKTIIGLTKNKDNIEKIKNAYGKEVQVSSFYIDNTKLNSKIIQYDNMLLKEEDNVKIQEIAIEMLKLYKEEKNIKLTKVS